jgi:hypothetical protein
MKKIVPNAELVSLLDGVNPALSRIYTGAIYAFNNFDNPERISQAAHSLRETDNRLIRHLNPEYLKRSQKFDKSDTNENTFKKNLQKGIDPSPYLNQEFEIYSRYTRLHQFFVDTCHHELTITDTDFLSKLRDYEKLSIELLSDYSTSQEFVDKILKVENPTTEQIDLLKLKIRFHALRKHLFQKAPFNWIEILEYYDFFEYELEANLNGISPPRYDLEFLLRMSKDKFKDHSKLVRIVCKYYLNKNSKKIDTKALETILGIAHNLKLEFTDQIMKIIVRNKWLSYPSDFSYNINTRIVSIISKYFQNGFFPRELIRYILEPKKLNFNPSVQSHKEIASIIKEYNNNPLKNVGYHEFIMFSKLFSKPFLENSKHIFYLSKLFIETLISIVESIEKIRIYKEYRRSESQFFFDFDSDINLSSLLLLNKISFVGENHVERSIELVIYDLTLRSINMGLAGPSSGKIIDFINETFSDLSEISIIHHKLLLSIYTRHPKYFLDKLADQLFLELGNEDLLFEYHHFVKTVLPLILPNVRRLYIQKVIELAANLDVEKEDLHQLSKLSKLYEPVHRYLPRNEKSKYSYYKKKYRGIVSNGTTATIIHSIIREDQQKLSYKKLIRILKSGGNNMGKEILLNNIVLYIPNLLNDLNDIHPDYQDIVIEGLIRGFQMKQVELSVLINFISDILSCKNSQNSTLVIVSVFINELLNDNSIFTKYGDKIFNLIRTLTNLLSFKFSTQNSTLDFSQLIKVYSSFEFHTVCGLIKFNLLSKYNLRQKGLIKETRFVINKILSKFDISVGAAIVYNLSSLLYLDKNYVLKNVSTLLPESKNFDVKSYYIIWSLFIKGNKLTDDLYDIVYDKVLLHILNLNSLLLTDHDEQYFRLIEFVLEPYLLKRKKSKLLFDCLVHSLPSHYKNHIIDVVGNRLNDSKNEIPFEFESSVLLQLINNPEFKGCPGFFKWFIYSPFDHNTSLDHLVRYVSDVDHNIIGSSLIIDNVIVELMSNIQKNEKKTLDIFLKILKKLLFYVDLQALYEVLKNTKERISCKRTFDQIMEYLVRLGNTEFETLKFHVVSR